MSENVKKLCLYCADCVKSSNRAFNNLKSNKDNKIIYTNDNEFAADDKKIIDMMTIAALNKSTMGIYRGSLFLEGEKGRNNYYSPLLYTPVELIREGEKIILQYDNDNICINIGLISSLLENDSDIVENVINQLMEIDEPASVDFESILRGLINLDGFEIKKENALFLAKTPENVAGLINELKKINEYYCNIS